jgi:hypothetical protein
MPPADLDIVGYCKSDDAGEEHGHRRLPVGGHREMPDEEVVVEQGRCQHAQSDGSDGPAPAEQHQNPGAQDDDIHRHFGRQCVDRTVDCDVRPVLENPDDFPDERKPRVAYDIIVETRLEEIHPRIEAFGQYACDDGRYGNADKESWPNAAESADCEIDWALVLEEALRDEQAAEKEKTVDGQTADGESDGLKMAVEMVDISGGLGQYKRMVIDNARGERKSDVVVIILPAGDGRP